jgi:hypothetical protein
MHSSPPKGYPIANPGAPLPALLSRAISASAADSATNCTRAVSHAHAQHAWGRMQAGGSVSTRGRQVPVTPVFPRIRSSSMPQQVVLGHMWPHGTELRYHSVHMSGSPPGVVGAYGLGAYIRMHRHEAASMLLCHPDDSATGSRVRIGNRTPHEPQGTAAGTGLSCVPKKSSGPKIVHTPGYALYEG